MLDRDRCADVRRVIVFASYNESENLRVILNALLPQMSAMDAVVIADDSGPEDKARLVEMVTELGKLESFNLEVTSSETKAGRGAAIRRGFELATKKYPEASVFVESDSDGSHRPVDIIKIRDWDESDAGLVIGSRYLRESEIVGWTPTRRAFSRSLNFYLPRLLNVPLKDVTNGLRRYSRSAVTQILNVESKNSGFIYLSEVAQLLHVSGFNIVEIPIVFDDRLHGSSSVTWREIYDSLKGVLGLLLGKRS